MTRSVFTEEYKLFCRLLIEERKKARIIQADLADKLKRPHNFVSKYEKGERRLDLIEFLEIAEAVGFDPLDFIKRLQDSK